MISQDDLSILKAGLRKQNYESLVIFLEELAEKYCDELDYYFYIGLVYLLSGRDEDAQLIWMSLLIEDTKIRRQKLQRELIFFLEDQIKIHLDLQDLANATLIYREIASIFPEYQNPDLLHQLVKNLSHLATSLSYDAYREEAITVYREILSLDSQNAKCWHSLALNYYYLNCNKEAQNAIKNAIAIDDISPQNYYLLALVSEKIKEYESAIDAYERTLRTDPYFVEAYGHLSDLYVQQKCPDKALKIYQKAVSFFSENASILDEIGKIINNQSLANLYFGHVAYIKAEYQSTIKYLELVDSEEYKDPDYYLKLLQCYLRCNQANTAIYTSQKALAKFTDNLAIKRFNQVILPVVYNTVEEINFYRQRFEFFLDEIIQDTDISDPAKREQAIKALGLITNFHLAYQGENDLTIQIKYAEYVRKIMAQLCPRWHKNRKFLSPTNNRKIRIGFISSRFHSLGILYFNWIKYISRSKFEVYLYDLSGKEESQLLNYQKHFQDYADSMVFIGKQPELNSLCEQISNNQLDILIMPEIGMDHIYTPFSCLRLAPIQCTTWAHPVTSGSPCIDYFLSSELMEPDNAQEHYSETLVRLPNLGFSLPSVTLPALEKRRSDFQLREDAVVYLCCQSLFKYLPQHDYVFAAIAKANTSFQFAFLDPMHGKVVTIEFEKRLDKVFSKLGLDYRQYCVFLPRMDQSEFLMLNQLSDIFLDALSWSGGLTTRDAIASGLPVVTLPGNMMRARHTYAILTMIGLTETIAKTEQDYINIAVKLGSDSVWRNQIRDKTLARKHLLFDDMKCISALEVFFEETVMKHPAKE